MVFLSIVLGSGFLFSLLLTPVVRQVAFRCDIVDRPDGHRKLHRHAIPLGGGVSVFLGTFLALAVVLLTDSPWKLELLQELRFAISMISAAGFLVLIGLLDDRSNLRGRQKLLGQLVAVAILIVSGLTIERVSILQWKVELGLLSLPFTAFWLLGAINALNLIDGVDGLASSIGVIVSMAIALMAVRTGHNADAVIAMAIAGSLLGFLCFNLPPASMFLGDAGSMLIGLCLGTLAIRCSLKGPATMALAAPVAVWAIPIFDVSMAILRRKLTGRSIYTTDRGHLHHVMQRRGCSSRKTLIWISALCGVTSAGALLSTFLSDERLALVSIAVVVLSLIVTRVFGHDECLLLAHRLSQTIKSLLPSRKGVPKQEHGDDFLTRFHDTHDWDSVWNRMRVLCEELGLAKCSLNLSYPVLSVDFHAGWSRKDMTDDGKCWSVELPLVWDSRAIGTIKLAGMTNSDSVSDTVSDLMNRMRNFEEDVYAVLATRQKVLQLENPSWHDSRVISPV